MKNNNIQPLLADMHYDGVRFDPRVLEALRNQKAQAANAVQNEREEA